MVNIYGSGGGGITSDDVTASRADVLNTVATITSDSNDEVVVGTLANIGATEAHKSVRTDSSNLYLGMTVGAHVTNASSGYPEVYIPLSTLRSKIGYTDAQKVLNGTTIAGLAGTMPNRGAVNTTLAINATYTIPAGYHNGAGKVQVDKAYSTKGAFTYTPNNPTSVQTIQAAGVYMSGNITLKGNANLKSENIKQGVTIFGIKGTAVDYEAGMVRY